MVACVPNKSPLAVRRRYGGNAPMQTTTNGTRPSVVEQGGEQAVSQPDVPAAQIKRLLRPTAYRPPIRNWLPNGTRPGTATCVPNKSLLAAIGRYGGGVPQQMTMNGKR